jgi:hypothetical protein
VVLLVAGGFPGSPDPESGMYTATVNALIEMLLEHLKDVKEFESLETKSSP